MTRLAAVLFLLGFVPIAYGQAKKPEGIKAAPSKITAVTVYTNTALVTREVTVADAVGLQEVVVSPIPAVALESSLYAEGSDGHRVLSVRFRTRTIAEDNREEVRQAEAKIKAATAKLTSLQADLKVSEENAKLLTKLESFTAATMTTLTEKGQLDSEKTIALATYIRDARIKHSKEDVTLKQQITTLQEEIAYEKSVMSETSGRPVHTERDAIITLDKTKPGVATVKLNYLVTNAVWHPQYKLRSGKDKEPVTVEYLASVGQRTGENWDNVTLTLSTAQPLLSAAPPELRAMEVSVTPVGSLAAGQMGGPGGMGGQAGGMGQFEGAVYNGAGGRGAAIRDLNKQSLDLKKKAAENFNRNNDNVGNTLQNSSAALDQYRELLLSKEEIEKDKSNPFAVGVGGLETPSVTYNLKSKMSVPSRNDDQILEIARFDLAAKNYFKAVPVLSPQVYRVADLINSTDYVLLPGEATMYQGTDFVGRASLPLVAIGTPFTVGFGVDPQLQAVRKLMDKTRTTQGGNQLLKFNYRILVTSYKTTPVDIQVWDRLPMSETAQVITVTLTTPKQPLSNDPLYERDERPKNLLRWDLKIDPKQNGEKALTLDYEFKLELDKNVNIAGLMSK
ncbi:MAG: mucoidy inhibitor MuiA family protein [Gemmataceae bacterium]